MTTSDKADQGGVFDKTNLRFDLGFPLRDKPLGGGRSPALYTGLQTQFLRSAWRTASTFHRAGW